MAENLAAVNPLLADSDIEKSSSAILALMASGINQDAGGLSRGRAIHLKVNMFFILH